MIIRERCARRITCCTNAADIPRTDNHSARGGCSIKIRSSHSKSGCEIQYLFSSFFFSCHHKIRGIPASRHPVDEKLYQRDSSLPSAFTNLPIPPGHHAASALSHQKVPIRASNFTSGSLIGQLLPDAVKHMSANFEPIKGRGSV